MTNSIVISYQLSKKLSRNSVKDIATEKQPNNLAANLVKAREIVRRLKRKRPIDLLI